MQNRKFGAITSSTNPNEIADRVKGIILMLSSIIILIAQQFFHIQLTAADVGSLATEIGTVGGLMWSLYGAIKWLVAKWFKNPNVV